MTITAGVVYSMVEQGTSLKPNTAGKKHGISDSLAKPFPWTPGLRNCNANVIAMQVSVAETTATV